MVKAMVTFETNDPEKFQQALGAFAPALASAKGYQGMDLRRGVELPNRFVLFVDWDAVADHMGWIAVNERPLLDAVGAYLSAPPDIKHYQ